MFIRAVSSPLLSPVWKNTPQTNGMPAPVRNQSQILSLHLSADFQVFLGKVDSLVMVPERGVGVSKAPAGSALPDPAWGQASDVHAPAAGVDLSGPSTCR